MGWSSTAKDALNSSAIAEEALAGVPRIISIITDKNEVVGTTTKEMSRLKYRKSGFNQVEPFQASHNTHDPGA